MRSWHRHEVGTPYPGTKFTTPLVNRVVQHSRGTLPGRLKRLLLLRRQHPPCQGEEEADSRVHIELVVSLTHAFYVALI